MEKVVFILVIVNLILSGWSFWRGKRGLFALFLLASFWGLGFYKFNERYWSDYYYALVWAGSVGLWGVYLTRLWPRKRGGKLKEWLGQNGVYVLIGLAGVVYLLLVFLRHQYFETNGYDLGIFDQAVWHYSRLEIPKITVRSLESLGGINNLSEGVGVMPNILGDHFNPILVLLAPLYWLWSDARMLLAAQVFFLIFGAIGCWKLVGRLIGEENYRLIGFSLVFGLLTFVGVQNALSFDFHPLVIASMLWPWAFYWAWRKKWGWYLGILILILSCRETEGLVVATWGLLMMIWKREWKWGLITMVLGVGWFLGTTHWLMPKLSQVDFPWPSSELGESAGEMLVNSLRHPRLVWFLLTGVEIKKLTLWEYFGGFGFLGILGWPALILLAPMVGMRFVVDNLAYWKTEFHYSVEVAPVMVLGAGLAAAWLLRGVAGWWGVKRGELALFLGLMILVSGFYINLWVPEKTFLSEIWMAESYQRPGNYDSLKEAARLIPKGARVSAMSKLVPQVSQRPEIYHFPVLNGAEYVWLNLGAESFWPMLNKEEANKLRLELAERSDYEEIYNRDEVYVYQRK